MATAFARAPARRKGRESREEVTVVRPGSAGSSGRGGRAGRGRERLIAAAGVPRMAGHARLLPDTIARIDGVYVRGACG